MTSMQWPPEGDYRNTKGGDGRTMVEQLSIIRLMNVLLSRRRVVLASTGLALSATIAVALVAPRSYSSSVSFVPQDRSPSLKDLAGVLPAAAFAPPGFAEQSSAFYADLLGSEELLRAAVLADYHAVDASSEDGAADDGRRSLVEIFEIESGDTEADTERAIRRLHRKIAVRVNRETGVVRYTVTTRSRDLSKQLAETLMSLINAFDLERRQSQAAGERQFLAARLDSARAAMRSAENKLELFLERNRHFRDSPTLAFEHDRLQREVMFSQQMLTSLTEAFERARIEEVRNTPVLTVMDRARASRLPDSRQLPIKALIATLAGLAIGIGAALWMEFMARSKVAEPEAYDEFVSLRRATWSGVRGLLPGRRKGA